MGRAPCCDKANVKKGPWSPEEDAKLKSYIEKHGTGGNWIALPQKIGLKRCGKSCRLRWLNYLRPNIKHGGFSEEEDRIICGLYVSIGSRWSIIAAQLPGRTDNDIKNYWNTRLKKKLLGKQRKEHQQQVVAAARKLKYTTDTTSSPAGITTAQKQQLLLPSSCPIFNDHHQNPTSNSIIMFNNNNNSISTNSAAAAAVQGIPPPYWSSPAGLYPINAIPDHSNYYMNNNHQQQLPPLNDHTSIRKFLLKLGEKLSMEDGNTTMHRHDHHQQLVSSCHDPDQVTNLENIPPSTEAAAGMCTYLPMASQAHEVVPALINHDHHQSTSVDMMISPIAHSSMADDDLLLLHNSSTSNCRGTTTTTTSSTPFITSNYNEYMNLHDPINSGMDDHMIIMPGGGGQITSTSSLFPQELEELMSSNYQQQQSGNSEIGLEYLNWDHDDNN